MKRALILILALLLTVKIVAAQDDFPPDPSEIFTDAVEVVEVYDPAANRQNIVVPIQDTVLSEDETRQLTVIYSGETSVFPYPDGVMSIRYGYSFIDSTVWLNVVESNNHDWVWILDFNTGEFSRFVARCGQLHVATVSDALQSWVFYIDPYDGHVYLCETVTGELSESLPFDTVWWTFGGATYTSPISVSPDQNWLAFFGADVRDVNSVYVYSYEIATGRLNDLGSFNPDLDYGISRWIGSQLLIGSSEMPEWSTRSIYIADAARPNSLELAVARFRFWPEYQENPPRYEFVAGTEGGDGPVGCSWIIYTIETRELITHDLGSMCLPDIGTLEGIGYYRDLSDTQWRTATLVQFNPLTGVREDLYSGEIEWVYWVSEDQHYAVLTLDDNGRINLHSSFYDLGRPAHPSIALVDLEDDEILYQASTGWQNPEPLFSDPNDSIIRQVDEDTFIALIDRSNDEHIHVDSYVSLLELVDGQINETHLIDNAVSITADNNNVIFRSSDSWSEAASYDLYEIASGNTISLTYDIDPNEYLLDFYSDLDGFITVYVWRSHAPNGAYPYPGVRWDDGRFVRYTIRVNPQE